MSRTAILSLDLGGTTLSGRPVRVEGRVRLQRAVPTFGRGCGAAVVEQILWMGEGLLGARQRRLMVAGFAMGVLATADPARGRIPGNIHSVPELEGVPLGPLLPH
jgi:hypothetical protein